MIKRRKKSIKVALSPNARILMKAMSQGVAIDELVNKTQMTQAELSAAGEELQSKGFAECYSEEEVGVVEVLLTDYGEAYLQGNPRLLNPIDTTSWWWMLINAVVSATIGGIAGALATWLIG